MRVNLRSLAIICFILPISTVIISYIASVKLNLAPYCIPNFEGCTSISRAGRNVPIKYFFKIFKSQNKYSLEYFSLETIEFEKQYKEYYKYVNEL